VSVAAVKSCITTVGSAEKRLPLAPNNVGGGRGGADEGATGPGDADPLATVLGDPLGTEVIGGGRLFAFGLTLQTGCGAAGSGTDGHALASALLRLLRSVAGTTSGSGTTVGSGKRVAGTMFGSGEDGERALDDSCGACLLDVDDAGRDGPLGDGPLLGGVGTDIEDAGRERCDARVPGGWPRQLARVVCTRATRVEYHLEMSSRSATAHAWDNFTYRSTGSNPSTRWSFFKHMPQRYGGLLSTSSQVLEPFIKQR